MSAFETKSITLGGQSFEVAPPAFKQLRVIIPAIARIAPKISAPDEATMDDMLMVIVAGLQAANPEVKRADVEVMRMSLQEMAHAIAVIVEVAGLEAGQGEAPAGAA
jgi:hypothetical protein